MVARQIERAGVAVHATDAIVRRAALRAQTQAKRDRVHFAESR